MELQCGCLYICDSSYDAAFQRDASMAQVILLPQYAIWTSLHASQPRCCHLWIDGWLCVWEGSPILTNSLLFDLGNRCFHHERRGELIWAIYKLRFYGQLMGPGYIQMFSSYTQYSKCFSSFAMYSGPDHLDVHLQHHSSVLCKQVRAARSDRVWQEAVRLWNFCIWNSNSRHHACQEFGIAGQTAFTDQSAYITNGQWTWQFYDECFEWGGFL